MNYKELIKKRKSIRKFKETKIDNQTLESIKEDIKQTETLFNHNLEAKLTKKEEINDLIKGIVGDYGKIIAPYYLILSSSGKKEELIDTGFYGEKIVLDFTKRSLGSCWIGKIGARKKIREKLKLENDPTALIAFGKAKNETFRRKEPKRKNINELILEGDLSDIDEKILELVRLAPSAINQQPWRFKIRENKIDFYLKKKGFIKKILKKFSNLQKLNYIDMGICLRHATLAMKELSLSYNFSKEPNEAEDMEYICTLIKEF